MISVGIEKFKVYKYIVVRIMLMQTVKVEITRNIMLLKDLFENFTNFTVIVKSEKQTNSYIR